MGYWKAGFEPVGIDIEPHGTSTLWRCVRNSYTPSVRCWACFVWYTVGMTDAAYVILFPGSQTNGSRKFRVTEIHDWVKFVNGATVSYAYTSYDTYAAAESARDALNSAT